MREYVPMVGPHPGEQESCGCQECGGTGELFTHSPDCNDDLCTLNGDMHSCYGLVLQCGCAMPPSSLIREP